MANVTVAGQEFSGVTRVELPVPGGTEKQAFIIPEGEIDISANGTVDVSGYAQAVVSVPSEEPLLQEKTVSANGTYTADSGYDGLSQVTVNVPEREPNLQTKDITANGTYSPDSGYDGFGQVVVNVPGEGPTLQEKTVSANGTYTADSGYDGLSQVTVNVPDKEPNLQTKDITANGTYGPDSGYAGFGQVVVNVPGEGSGDGGFSGTPATGDTPVIMNASVVSAKSSGAMTATGVAVNIPMTGTYRVRFVVSGGDSTSASYRPSAQLYKNGTAVGSAVTNTGSPSTTIASEDIDCVSGDVLEVYLKGYSYWGNTIGSAGMLVVSVDWANGFGVT